MSSFEFPLLESRLLVLQVLALVLKCRQMIVYIGAGHAVVCSRDASPCEADIGCALADDTCAGHSQANPVAKECRLIIQADRWTGLNISGSRREQVRRPDLRCSRQNLGQEDLRP